MKPLTAAQGNLEALLAAMRHEAQLRIDELKAEAQTGEETVLESAEAAGARALRDQRLRAARREATERLAREDWLDGRQALEAREAWLAEVKAAAHARLLAEPPDRDRLARLAAEAARALPGDVAVVHLTPAAREVVDAEWARALAEETGKTEVRLESDPSLEGGCLARTPDGRVRFDNTWSARAERMDPILRRALAEHFDP